MVVVTINNSNGNNDIDVVLMMCVRSSDVCQ
jgi:hypothetical protein